MPRHQIHHHGILETKEGMPDVRVVDQQLAMAWVADPAPAASVGVGKVSVPVGMAELVSLSAAGISAVAGGRLSCIGRRFNFGRCLSKGWHGQHSHQKLLGECAGRGARNLREMLFVRQSSGR